MVLAHHVIFTAYGFWLPNDPRGSWSDWVASWELLKFGTTTRIGVRRSVAAAVHDVFQRQAAKSSLRRSPVAFDGRQALAIARGFSTACDDAGYLLRACAILPEHVHAVILRHARKAETIVGHLKSEATRQLRMEGLHPFDHGAARIPSVWAEGCWKRFLNSGDDILRAVRYVNDNPQKEGKPRQNWNMVTPIATGV